MLTHHLVRGHRIPHALHAVRVQAPARGRLLFPVLLLAMALLAACAPLTRGLSGDSVVSSSRPSVQVRPSTGLALLGSGAASPLLQTELGQRHVDVNWAFYADATRERQLAVLLSEVPDGWQWELDVSSPWREVRRDVFVSGPARFSGATYLMPADADPFAAMQIGRAHV